MVAEAALGKRLPPNAVVHHVDGVGGNNAKTNLVICEDQAYHVLLHRRQRAREACGDANKWQCRHCRCWDTVGAVKVSEKRKNGRPNGYEVYHPACNAQYVRDFNAKKKARG